MEVPKKPLALRIDSERLIAEKLFGWISVVLSECTALAPVALHPVRGPFGQRDTGQPAPVSFGRHLHSSWLCFALYLAPSMCRRA